LTDVSCILPGPCGGGFADTRFLHNRIHERGMDPQTLPAVEQAIYHRIRQQYRVAFEPLRFGSIRLNLLKITDLESLLKGKDPLNNPSDFPVWVRLWESAVILARYLAGQQYAPGTKLLELGAGLGASGLAAAAAGCDVTLTDYEELILDFERVSAAASRLENVRFAILDWKNPPEEMEQYDIIAGTEILYREEFFDPLLRVIRRALKPDGVVYLAHDARRQSIKPFLHMAEAEYTIAASMRRLKNNDEDRAVLLNRLIPKK
jgi:predicted nicotinamide N-methyase